MAAKTVPQMTPKALRGRSSKRFVRANTIAVCGVALGDEGKGRIVDNKLGALLEIPGVTMAYVIRCQGGNNAGHTVEKSGKKLALHQVPSGVMYDKAVGIMDRGMVIHPEDLQTEVAYVEEAVGDTRGKLILSQDAILTTDLERAEEILNRKRQHQSGGGTGRGISPAYAHFTDRLGNKVSDILEDNWREEFGKKYDNYVTLFQAFDMSLAQTSVPDFRAIKQKKAEIARTVGSKQEFLDRLESARTWLIKRDIVQNTFLIHASAYKDLSKGIIFEMAQAMGLHLWNGTRPDVTSSDTSLYGIQSGTGFWKAENISERLGVFKITYTSSVGAREMPTMIPLAKSVRGPADLVPDATNDEKFAAFVRQEAHEFGTTTGRPRDILWLDIPFLTYNIHMSGVESLAATHLDIARSDMKIKICTHYADLQGNVVPYQPGLEYQQGVVPAYVELDGWDSQDVRNATSFDDLPENAQKFLAFIQRRTGVPIVIATTGPDRKNYLDFEMNKK
ncbi:MAG: Adenylosuccinate synthetase [Microgenomates group bacterium GW2011_GWA2_44_7]|nr:MAG: Adenylosuccinate synthetase [Microgenomates group bacterium GW2011_GWA2_44_7]